MSQLATDEHNRLFGERLVAVRQASGLTQVEFADKLQLSARAYQNYERGEREPPVAVLSALLKSFRIDPLWMLEGQGGKPVHVEARADDTFLLENILRMVEQHLANRKAKLSPEKKARLVRLIYEHCVDESVVDERYLKEMVLLTA